MQGMTTSSGGTYWNGEPAEARIVKVIVGKSERPTWWCADMEGQEAEAIEITQHGQTFHIFNDVDGRYKVTFGFGSPRVGHKGLPVAEVLEDISGVVEYMSKHKDGLPEPVKAAARRETEKREESFQERSARMRKFDRERIRIEAKKGLKRRIKNKREKQNRKKGRR